MTCSNLKISGASSFVSNLTPDIDDYNQFQMLLYSEMRGELPNLCVIVITALKDFDFSPDPTGSNAIQLSKEKVTQYRMVYAIFRSTLEDWMRKRLRKALQIVKEKGFGHTNVLHCRECS